MKSIKKLINIVQEDLIGTDNRLIATTWALCLAGIIAMSFYLGSQSMSFLGVADSRELQVNFEYPVEIKRIHVISGQRVSKGELLIELNQSDLNSRIRLNRSSLDKLRSEMKVRQQLNAIVSNSRSVESSDPLSVNIADLEQELVYLENQKKNLYIFAEVAGIVGTVNVKKGEKVPSFTSLLTLSPENPSNVVGFVHENLQTKLEIGKKVTVSPLPAGIPVEGTIVSVGSRVIQIPFRLMTYPNMQVWGREVVVEIPPRNGFLLGEKVQITPKFKLLGLSTANAAVEKEGNLNPSIQPIDLQLPAELARSYSFEPSGALYLPDLKKFLVISDDTDAAKTPLLFLVNRDGRVDEQPMLIPNLAKISDLESISQDADWIYVLSSQSLAKKDQAKPERNLFVRFKRSGLDLHSTESLELKPLLMEALKNSNDSQLRALFEESKDGKIEIESHFVEKGDLYLGFKKPRLQKTQTVLVVIRDVNSLFQKRALPTNKLSLWKTVEFADADGAPYRLTDLIKVDGALYAATVCKGGECGAIWRLQGKDSNLTPEMVKTFAGLKPEGIAYDPTDHSLFVTFDQGQSEGKFARIPLSPVMN